MISTYAGSSADALERLRRLADCSADRGGRGIDFALRQPQQRQARLRLEATPTRLAVGVLGGIELPPQPMDLPLSVVGLAAGELVEDAPREPLGGSPRLLQGLLPRAAQLHDLGAVDEAETVVGDHLGLALAPPRQRLGPLPGVAELVGVATEGDRVAVDDPGDDRRQLARRGGDQDLVDQPQALGDPPVLDQRATLVVPREPQEVAIAEPLSDLGGLGRGGMGGLVVAASHLLQPDGDQQIAALDAVLLDSFEQTPPAREPSTRSPALAPEQQVVADPERAAGSGRHLLRFEVRMVGTLQSADVVVVTAEHVRGARQELEIPRVERRGPIRAGQRLERFAPRTLGVGRPTSFRLDDRIHRADYRARANDSLAVDRPRSPVSHR